VLSGIRIIQNFKRSVFVILFFIWSAGNKSKQKETSSQVFWAPLLWYLNETEPDTDTLKLSDMVNKYSWWNRGNVLYLFFATLLLLPLLQRLF